MRRLGLNLLKPGGATDGQALLFDEASQKWIPGDVSGGGASGGGTLLLDYGDSVPAETPAGTVVYQKAPTPTVYDFTAGALPAGWVKHGTPSETFDAAGMTTTFAAGQGYHIPTTPAGDFSVEIRLLSLSSTGTMFGPTITSTAGAGVGAAWYNAPAGLLNVALSSWAYASSFTNTGGTFAVPCRIRITRRGTLFYATRSVDNGASWSPETTSLSSSTTPGAVGFGGAFGSGTAKVEEVVVRTASRASAGTPLGWWDGSQIQPLY